MAGGGGVAATATRAMMAAFAALGLDAARIMAEAGVADGDLADPDGFVPAERFYRLWETAGREWGRPGLGLQVASRVPFGAYEVIDFLLRTSPTVGAAIAALAEYMAIATSTARYAIHEDDNRVACEMVWRIPPRGAMFQLRDYSLALVVGRVAHVSGRRPVEVEVTAPALAPARDYARAFGAPARLRASRNAAVYSRAAWEAPIPSREALLNQTLRRHARLLLDRRRAGDRDTIAGRVHARLLASSRVGLAPVGEVAAHLAMSARSLQRRLRDEGTSFEAIGRDVLASLAEAYLGDRGLSVSETAYLLGFSEPSAFSRAFRRWTGVTPRAFRRRARAASIAPRGATP